MKDAGFQTTRSNGDAYISVYGQNVLALEPLPGMEYTYSWLKSEKLHKYWPTISRLTYHQLLALNCDNWEATLQSVGVRSYTITKGAKGKILRLIQELRQRATRLKELLQSEDTEQIFVSLSGILGTPLPDLPELDGEELIPLIRKTLARLKIRNRRDGSRTIRKVQQLMEMLPPTTEKIKFH